MLITTAVLIFLNIYCFRTSQEIFFNSKKASMIERCLLASEEIADLEVLNQSTVNAAVSGMGNFRVSRIIITDHTGLVIHDSVQQDCAVGTYALLPEIMQAMDVTKLTPEGNDVFSGIFRDGVLRSSAATPIWSYGSLVGCVYMLEFDTHQGALLKNLQTNIFSITLVLELAVIVFSLFYSRRFSRRLQRIMASMRIIQKGDFTHRVDVGGRDELTFLGDEFNDLTERLQTSERKRAQFVSDASHELKTPLASIKLLTDSILQNDMDPETIREFVEDIGNEADRLTRMSHKLLSLARIESQADSDCEIVNLRPTVEKVFRMLSATASKQQITMELVVKEDSPILILEDDLYQIAFNLAENGIKYNTPGGSLTITLDRQDDNALLIVSDTGVGIPPDAISHVFERFYRVDKARSRQSGGSGLGLAIVRNMVERNHGTIHVQSTYGSGSTFTVSFPIFDTEEEIV